MTSSHTIRLRGPWQFQPLLRAERCPDEGWRFTTDGLLPGGEIHLPGSWLPETASPAGEPWGGLVRLSRRFSRPTGLTPQSRIQVSIAEVGGLAAVSLNGAALGAIAGDPDPRQVADKVNLPAELVSAFKEPRACPAAWEVGSLLRDRNELTIDLWALAAGRVGLVTLEIEQPA